MLQSVRDFRVLILFTMILTISCKNQNKKISDNSKYELDSIAWSINENNKSIFFNLITTNLQKENLVESKIDNIIDSLSHLKLKERVVVIVATNMDCFSCIDRQLVELMKNYTISELSSQFVLIVNNALYNTINSKWPRVVKSLNFIVFKDVEDLIMNTGYSATHPMFIVLDIQNKKSLGTIVIDQKFADLDILLYEEFKKILNSIKI